MRNDADRAHHEAQYKRVARLNFVLQAVQKYVPTTQHSKRIILSNMSQWTKTLRIELWSCGLRRRINSKNISFIAFSWLLPAAKQVSYKQVDPSWGNRDGVWKHACNARKLLSTSIQTNKLTSRLLQQDANLQTKRHIQHKSWSFNPLI